MKLKHFCLIFIVISLNITLAAADLDIGLGTSSNVPEVSLTSPEITVNYSLQNVNRSDFWDSLDTYNSTQMYEGPGGVLSILESWLTTFINNIIGNTDNWVNETGDTMTGDLILQNETVEVRDPNDDISIFFENKALIVEG